jgi:hypothetical protein
MWVIYLFPIWDRGVTTTVLKRNKTHVIIFRQRRVAGRCASGQLVTALGAQMQEFPLMTW